MSMTIDGHRGGVRGGKPPLSLDFMTPPPLGRRLKKGLFLHFHLNKRKISRFTPPPLIFFCVPIYVYDNFDKQKAAKIQASNVSLRKRYFLKSQDKSVSQAKTAKLQTLQISFLK